MKGSREAPRCGFSATLVGILDSLIPDYQAIDVLAEPELRDGIKSSPPGPPSPSSTSGGVHRRLRVQELHRSGELHEKLGVEKVEEARAGSRSATRRRRCCGASRPSSPGHVLQLSIDARFRSALGVGPRARRDRGQRQRAGDRHGSPHRPAGRGRPHRPGRHAEGPALSIDIPNAPDGVKPMGVRELEERLEAGERFEFLDMRSPEERAVASIPGSTLLTPEVAKRLESLPRDSMFVFHSHRGDRGKKAAKHFAALGFTNVWNVQGGIDAWSQEIDPDVPRLASRVSGSLSPT